MFDYMNLNIILKYIATNLLIIFIYGGLLRPNAKLSMMTLIISIQHAFGLCRHLQDEYVDRQNFNVASYCSFVEFQHNYFAC